MTDRVIAVSSQFFCTNWVGRSYGSAPQSCGWLAIHKSFRAPLSSILQKHERERRKDGDKCQDSERAERIAKRILVVQRRRPKQIEDTPRRHRTVRKRRCHDFERKISREQYANEFVMVKSPDHLS